MNEISGLFLIIITMGLIFLYYNCSKQMNNQIGKPNVRGTVIDSNQIKAKKYLITVKYTIDDKEYTNTVISKRNYSKDSKIPIIYNKKDPNKIKLDLFKSFYGEGEGELIGMVCMYLCIPLLLFGLLGTGFEYIIKS